MWRFRIVGLVLLAGPAFAQVEKSVSCEREPDCLARLSAIAQRRGDTLRLKLANGATKTLTGNHQACDNDDAEKCLRYNLRAYLPAQHAFVVAWNGYEENGSLVISTKTGRSVELDFSLPQFSPSGRWFASVNVNTIDESQYAVAIWSTAPDVPKQVFRHSARVKLPFESWEFAGWEGDDRFRLKVEVNPGTGQTRTMETSAVLTKQGWKLDWPLPVPK